MSEAGSPTVPVASHQRSLRDELELVARLVALAASVTYFRWLVGGQSPPALLRGQRPGLLCPGVCHAGIWTAYPFVILSLALVGSTLARAAAQEPVDTVMTIQGFLQQDNQFGNWTIVVPLPLQVLGTRTFVVPVVGEADRWSRFVNRYIEATGRITRLPERGTPEIGMEVDKAKEVEPPGTARTSMHHGMTLSAEVTLSVIPNRFAWHDADRGATGVNPMLLYTILNRRTAPIFFFLPKNNFLCVSVKASDGTTLWDSTTQVASPDARRFALQRAGIFRDAVHFPEDAAARPGHYFAHVGVCDVDDYDITAEFVVQ